MSLGLYRPAAPWNGFSLSGGNYTTLTYPGSIQTQAQGINNKGTIVGAYLNGGVNHGFSLSGSTYTTIDYPGAIWTSAGGISDGGTIVGGYAGQDGVEHAFVATPTPIPGAVWLLGSGLISLVGIRRKFST